MVDCTEVAEGITKLRDHTDDPCGCRASGEFFDPLRNFQLGNEQIRKPKGLLLARESEPARNQSYMILMDCHI
jgi:hypothetical protein